MRGEALNDDEKSVVATPSSTRAVIDQANSSLNDMIEKPVEPSHISESNKSPIIVTSKNDPTRNDVNIANVTPKPTSKFVSGMNTSQFNDDMRSYVSPSSTSVTSAVFSTNSVSGLKNVNASPNDVEVKTFARDDDAATPTPNFNRMNIAVKTPSTVNSSVLANAVVNLNKMADEFIRHAQVSSNDVSSRANNGLNEFIMNPNQEQYEHFGVEDIRRSRFDDDIDVLNLRRKYLKEWISRCKTLSKGDLSPETVHADRVILTRKH